MNSKYMHIYVYASKQILKFTCIYIHIVSYVCTHIHTYKHVLKSELESHRATTMASEKDIEKAREDLLSEKRENVERIRTLEEETLLGDSLLWVGIYVHIHTWVLSRVFYMYLY
jgi:hypothetical protein